MNRFRTILVLGGLLLTDAAPAADAAAAPAAVPAPHFDAAAFLAGSGKVLHEREPELTPAEYAIYEQVVPMATTQPDFALKLLEGMVDKEDTSAAFDLILGNVYFELQRMPEAEARYRRAIEKYGDFRRAWENLGVLYYTLERPADAVPCFSRVVALGGLEPRILGLLGYCLARSGNAGSAELAYMQAAVIEPDNPDWTEGLLHVVLDTKQLPRAEALLTRLTRLQPRDSQHWEMLARVIVAQQRPLDATVPLEIAAGLHVLSPDGLQLLGDLYADAGLAREAVRAYERLATLDPAAGTDRLVTYARALVETKDVAGAEKILTAIEPTATGPQELACLQVRADCAIARGEPAAAETALQTLLARSPLDGPALLQLAGLQAARNDVAHAILSLESATHVPDVAFSAHLQLAQLHVRNRAYELALAALDHALALQDAPVVREYRARVAALTEDAP